MFANSGSPCTVYSTGSFENEAPKSQKRSTQNSKVKHPNLVLCCGHLASVTAVCSRLHLVQVRWSSFQSNRSYWLPFFLVVGGFFLDIVPCPFSDRSAVLLSSSVPQASPLGSGLWKLNVSVLEEPDYFRLISDFWSGWRHRMPAFASLSDWWEMGKSRIKGLTIDYCCRRSQSKSQERDLLA